MTSFGYYVAAARQEKGWRQSYLAVSLEISGSYVNDIEKGRRYPPGEYLLQRFASALELDPDYLCLLAGIIPHDVRAAIGATDPEAVQRAFRAFREALAPLR